jgi:hypothetical protein
MKTVVAVAATALVCASTGFATGVAVTPGQFNALKARVAKLEARVSKAEAGVAQALGETAAIRNCNKQVVAVAQGAGYLRDLSGSPYFQPNNVFRGTALDRVAAGTSGSFWLGVVDATCVGPLGVYRSTRLRP